MAVPLRSMVEAELLQGEDCFTSGPNVHFWCPPQEASNHPPDCHKITWKSGKTTAIALTTVDNKNSTKGSNNNPRCLDKHSFGQRVGGWEGGIFDRPISNFPQVVHVPCKCLDRGLKIGSPKHSINKQAVHARNTHVVFWRHCRNRSSVADAK